MTYKLFADPTDTRSVHFVGIGGAGMSALAELFVRRGVRVTGCDSVKSAAVDDLERLGIQVQIGHDASHINDDTRAVVVTSAAPKDHPEIVRAHSLGIPVIRRAEALGEAVSGGHLVGIAGTHGKTTTTVMTTMALSAAGLNPTGVVGGRVAAWEGNLSSGGNDLFVVEADEYDRSFLALDPTVAVIGNIEADHLDIYRDFADIHETFAVYARDARYIVLCADDHGATSLPTPSTAEVIRYGITSPDARLVASNVAITESGSTFTVIYDGEPLGDVRLSVHGRHNILNALAAIGAGLAMGATVPAMAQGLAEFKGVQRRFERIADIDGITIIDDYAHHPTEVTVTLQAARAAFPNRKIVAAFQPHLYTRTRDFATEFAEALRLADEVYLVDIYPAREQPIVGVTSELIATHLRDESPLKVGKLAWTGARTELAAALQNSLCPNDVVITIGAGDITKTGPELATLLTAKRSSIGSNSQHNDKNDGNNSGPKHANT